MAEKSIEQRVKDIIVEQLGVNADQVTPEAKFIEDLGRIRSTPWNWSWRSKRNSATKSPTSRPKNSKASATSSNISKTSSKSSCEWNDLGQFRLKPAKLPRLFYAEQLERTPVVVTGWASSLRWDINSTPSGKLSSPATAH